MSGGMVVLTSEELLALIRQAVSEAQAAAARLVVAPNRAREFLTSEQLAERLGVCTKSIKTMVRRDGLPMHIVGPRLQRFLWSEVEQWLERRGKNVPPAKRAPALHVLPSSPRTPPNDLPPGTRPGRRYVR